MNVGELIKRVQIADQLGVDQSWLDQQPDQRDAIVVSASYLSAAPAMSVGTAVLPVYARHPVAMAQAAAALDEISDGRFILGLGFSHQFINEYVLGYRQGPPIAVMREYLSIIRNLLTDGSVDMEGRFFTAHAQYSDQHRPVPIYLAALRPQMIRLAVEFGEGIVTWLCSPRYLAEHIMPAVRAACAEFGRDEREFTVLTILPSYAGADALHMLSDWERSVRSYRMLPYYRHVLDFYGKPDPHELSLIGTSDVIQQRLAEYRATGCTPLPSPMVCSEEDFIQTIQACYGDD
jgi:5,10-methylenetetrahydromethanopterin reductase